MKHCPLFLLFALLHVSTFAQKDSTYASLSFQPGVRQIKEESLHPKVMQGAVLSLEYQKFWIAEKISHFSISGSFGKPSSAFESTNTSLSATLEASWACGKQLQDRKKYQLWLAAEARLHYDIAYYPNWDESHLYHANFLSLGPAAFAAFNLPGGGTVSLQISLPLIGVTSRPEEVRLYKIDDLSLAGLLTNFHANVKAARPDRLFFTDVGLSFLPTGSRIGLEYIFQYLRIRHPESRLYQQLNHQLGIQYHFSQ